MKSPHDPERQPGESQQDYRFRMKASRELARLMRRGVVAWATKRGTRLNADKKTRREAIKAIGRRQFLKQSKAARRAA
jgi:hypothetical protein